MQGHVGDGHGTAVVRQYLNTVVFPSQTAVNQNRTACRTAYLLAQLAQDLLEGQPKLALARTLQGIKMVDWAVRGQTDWGVAWQLCHTAAPGAMVTSLDGVCHPAEVAGLTAMVSEQESFKTKLKKSQQTLGADPSRKRMQDSAGKWMWFKRTQDSSGKWSEWEKEP